MLLGGFHIRFVVKGYRKQRLHIVIMVFGVIKIQHADTVHLLYAVCQLLRLIKGNIADQNPGGSVSDKLLVHQIQSPSCFRCIRKICCQIIVDLYLIHGQHAEHAQHNKYQVKTFPLVYNQRSQLYHKGIFLFPLFRTLCHNIPHSCVFPKFRRFLF